MGSPTVTISDTPKRSTYVLLALVTGAVVSNINLGIANVALPSIGRDLHANQDQLTYIANAFALGLAATVLYLGSIGDRYGRKMLFVLGAVLTIPTACLAAWSVSANELIVARLLSGLAAALLFPTTLSLIGALYRGKAQITAIALWSGIGGGMAAVGPLLGGWMLEHYWWGSVFLITVPLDVLALAVGLIVLPWHAGEERFSVDHLGGVLSVIGVGGLVLAIELAGKGITASWLTLVAIAIAVLILFFWRQTRAARPLIALNLAKAPTFWVAFVAGAITFGSLIAVMFIGQQFTQNVLGYSTIRAAAVVLPAALFTAIGGQVAGKIIAAKGSQFCFMLGLGAVACAFTIMTFVWTDSASVWWVMTAYAFTGAGVGLAATPASRALMSSVPLNRSGMGSAFLDLTRDFGGAILQAMLGGILAATYSAHIRDALTSLTPAQASQVSTAAAQEMTASYAGAAQVATGYPAQAAHAITSTAAAAFTDGKSLALASALGCTLIGLVLVLWKFPGKAAETAFYQSVATTGASADG